MTVRTIKVNRRQCWEPFSLMKRYPGNRTRNHVCDPRREVARFPSRRVECVDIMPRDTSSLSLRINYPLLPSAPAGVPPRTVPVCCHHGFPSPTPIPFPSLQLLADFPSPPPTPPPPFPSSSPPLPPQPPSRPICRYPCMLVSRSSLKWKGWYPAGRSVSG